MLSISHALDMNIPFQFDATRSLSAEQREVEQCGDPQHRSQSAYLRMTTQ
jgi:hypothetical protein